MTETAVDALRLADPATRLAARAVDGIIVWAVAAVVVPFGIVTGSPEAVFAGTTVSLGLGLVVGLVNLWLLHRSGQTLGKRLLRVRIVAEDGTRVPFSRLFWLRMALPTLGEALPLVGPIFAALNVLTIFGPSRRCIHDHLAGTRVIDLRGAG